MMFLGILSSLVVCHPGRSISNTAQAPGATARLISMRCFYMAQVLAKGITTATSAHDQSSLCCCFVEFVI